MAPTESGRAYSGRVSLHDIPLTTLDGRATTLGEHAGRVLLVVNVASRCGLTPQYAGLEQLQQEYGERGLTVIGFPCNQFGGQEPGTAEEIETFCSTRKSRSPLHASGAWPRRKVAETSSPMRVVMEATGSSWGVSPPGRVITNW